MNEERCMYCGNCYTMCPALPVFDSAKGRRGPAGGRQSLQCQDPAHVLPSGGALLPNNPPRWPEVVQTIRKILIKYAEGANKWERVGEWVERIGWEKFFEICEIPFTFQHIDDYRSGRMIPIGRRCILNSKQVVKNGTIQSRSWWSSCTRWWQRPRARNSLRPWTCRRPCSKSTLIRDKTMVKFAIKELIDGGRCVYTYFGGSFIEMPPKKAPPKH